MTIELQPGDIVCTQGHSFISKAIRFFSRTGGESRTKINHVGMVVAKGSDQTAVIVEARSKVVRRSIHAYWDGDTAVAIFRPKHIQMMDRQNIVNRANAQVGKSYGYIKIVAHFLDWCLGGRYFFRRVTGNGRYPICAWVVADAYAQAGYGFGVPVGQAQPDDIWDYCVYHSEQYQMVHLLKPLGGWTIP